MSCRNYANNCTRVASDCIIVALTPTANFSSLSSHNKGSGWAFKPRSYRDITVDNQQLFPCYVKLAAQFVGLPVNDPESFVIRIENGLQKLQFGLQPRHRHLPRISGRSRWGGGRSPDLALSQLKPQR